MIRLPAILLLCVLVLPASAVQIVEFCPDPYLTDDPDEYLVLQGEGPLNGISVSDGEGGFRFPPGEDIHGQVVVARNAPAYVTTHGALPDYELFDYSTQVPEVIRGDDLRMGNSRDELILYQDGSEIQRISWPGDVHPREGQIHYLEDGVWDRRVLLIGQSRFEPAVFRNVTLTAFASPDSSREVFERAIQDADREILVNIYEFSSRDMAGMLANASARGVSVQMLVEGGPVGGITPEERYICGVLNRSGIPIYEMATQGDVHAKYRFNHAKYLVVDGESVIITSENFNDNGFPPTGSSGNRGWGVYVESPDLAGYFERVFRWDISGGDVVPMVEYAGSYPAASFEPYRTEFTPTRFEGASVTPVLAPDTSDLILSLLNEANSSIDIEQAYITNQTMTELNPFLAAAIDAARRGVVVRVLLDSYWFNTEDTADNDEMSASLNRIARTEGLPLTARCADLMGNDMEKIHNKGVIVDGRKVLVSSINWNENSPTFNREAGLIIDHPGAATYFTAVFEDDWSASQAPEGDASGVTYSQVTALLVVVIALLGLYWYRHRRF